MLVVTDTKCALPDRIEDYPVVSDIVEGGAVKERLVIPEHTAQEFSHTAETRSQIETLLETFIPKIASIITAEVVDERSLKADLVEFRRELSARIVEIHEANPESLINPLVLATTTMQLTWTAVEADNAKVHKRFLGLISDLVEYGRLPDSLIFSSIEEYIQNANSWRQDADRDLAETMLRKFISRSYTPDRFDKLESEVPSLKILFKRMNERDPGGVLRTLLPKRSNWSPSMCTAAADAYLRQNKPYKALHVVQDYWGELDPAIISYEMRAHMALQQPNEAIKRAVTYGVKKWDQNIYHGVIQAACDLNNVAFAERSFLKCNSTLGLNKPLIDIMTSAYIRAGEAAKGRKLAEYSISTYGQNFRNLFRLTESKKIGGDTEGAIEHLPALAKLVRNNGDRLLLADVAAKLHQAQLACDLLKRIDRVDRSPKTCRVVVTALRGAGRAEEAYQYFKGYRGRMTEKLAGEFARLLHDLRKFDELNDFTTQNPAARNSPIAQRFRALIVRGSAIDSAASVREDYPIVESDPHTVTHFTSLFLKAGKLEQAELLLHAYRGERDAAVVNTEANVLLQREKAEQAVRSLEQLPRNQWDSRSYSLQIMALGSLDRTDELRKEFQNLESGDATHLFDRQLAHMYGIFLITNRDNQQLTDFCDRASTQALLPDFELAHLRSLATHSRRDYEQLAKALKPHMKRDSDPKLVLRYGHALFRSGNFRGCHRFFSKRDTLAQSPDPYGYFIWLRSAHIVGEYEDTIRIFNEANSSGVELRGAARGAHVLALSEYGEYELAENRLQEALERHPTNSILLGDAATFYLQHGDAKAALPHVQRMVANTRGFSLFPFHLLGGCVRKSVGHDFARQLLALTREQGFLKQRKIDQVERDVFSDRRFDPEDYSTRSKLMSEFLSGRVVPQPINRVAYWVYMNRPTPGELDGTHHDLPVRSDSLIMFPEDT